MKLRWSSFNPLNTLVGRLLLITAAVLIISHGIALTLFVNERGAAVRRQAEAQAEDRIAASYQRLADADARQRENLASELSGYNLRLSLVDTPLNAHAGGSAGRIARALRDDIGADADVRTSMRDVDMPIPVRRMVFEHARRHHRHGEHGADDRGSDDRGSDDRGSDDRGGGEDVLPPRLDGGAAPRTHRVTEATFDLALPDGGWMRARVFLPSPPPTPIHMWATIVFSTLAVGIGALFVARQLSRPLAQLADAAERLGRGESGVQTSVSGPADVRRAAGAFNDMAARLSRQMQRQRQMLWALSHDVRTPITALKLRAELIEDDAARERMLAPIAEIQAIAEQALDLARAGAGAEARIDVDIAEIARTLCGELNDMGVAGKVDAPQDVRIPCRPGEIARAMRNLLENAAKYAGGGVLSVSRNAKGEAVIEVRDDGPGVSEGLIAQIATPFFRADQSRSESATSASAGLGLAIVQAIADGHGGKLVLENRKPHGLCARLILPA